MVRAPSDPRTRAMGADGWPRFGLLLLAVIASVAVQGAVAPGEVQQVVVSVLLGISLILAFAVARASRTLTWLAWLLATVGVVTSVLEALTDVVGDGEVRVVSAALAAFGPPAVALGVLRSLRASRAVGVQAVMGVLSLYMLIGMFFAWVYGAIDKLGGDPFFTDGTSATVSNCLYYSFTTLTTVGYGDLTARTDLGHTLSIFEALTGQIYLVTVVALIVSNLGRRSPRQPD
jgi:Ion channel